MVLDRTLDDLPLHLWVVCLEAPLEGRCSIALDTGRVNRESFGSWIWIRSGGGGRSLRSGACWSWTWRQTQGPHYRSVPGQGFRRRRAAAGAWQGALQHQKESQRTPLRPPPPTLRGRMLRPEMQCFVLLRDNRRSKARRATVQATPFGSWGRDQTTEKGQLAWGSWIHTRHWFQLARRREGTIEKQRSLPESQVKPFLAQATTASLIRATKFNSAAGRRAAGAGSLPCPCQAEMPTATFRSAKVASLPGERGRFLSSWPKSRKGRHPPAGPENQSHCCMWVRSPTSSWQRGGQD